MEPQTAQPQAPQKAENKKVLLLLLALLGLLVIGFLGYLIFARQSEKEPTSRVVTGLSRDSIVIGQRSAVTGVFPDSAPEFYSVVFNNHIFEGLGRIVDGEPKPALATSWTNQDKNTWRFMIRKGVKFHNGNTLTADDVKFSIDEALKNNWPNAFNLGTVKSVTVVDDFTVDIKTNGPDPVLLNRLVYAFVVSEKQFKEKGDKPAVGTGPYKFVGLNKSEAILESNGDYYLGQPKIKKVTWKFLPNASTDEKLVEAVKNGEVDIIAIRGKNLGNAVGSGYQVKTLADPFITFLWLDTARDKSPYISKSPSPLKNKLVREAMYKVVDINRIIESSEIAGVAASQFVTEDIFGYNPDVKRPEPNVEEAKNLMKQAGLPDGFSLTVDLEDAAEPVFEPIIKELAKINVKVKLNPISFDDLGKKVFETKDTSAFILEYGAETFDAGEIFLNVLHTPGGGFGGDNFLKFNNLEIDKLAEEIATTFESRSRREKLQETTKKAVVELPMIPLFSTKFTYIFRDNFDWTPTSFGAIYVNEISGREIVTE